MGNEIFLTCGKGNGIHVPVVIDVRIPLEHFIPIRSGGGGSTFEHAVLVPIQPKGVTVVPVVDPENIGATSWGFEAGSKEGHVIDFFPITVKILDQSGTYVIGALVVLGVSSKGITLNVHSLVGGHRTKGFDVLEVTLVSVSGLITEGIESIDVHLLLEVTAKIDFIFPKGGVGSAIVGSPEQSHVHCANRVGKGWG